jgi:hypothetical protein
MMKGGKGYWELEELMGNGVLWALGNGFLLRRGCRMVPGLIARW